MAINVRSGKVRGTIRVPTTLLLLVGLLGGLATLPGCSGCNWSRTSTQAKAKKDGKKENELEESELEKKRKKLQEKPKDDFEPLTVRMLPSNDPTASMKQPPVHVKPGHWIAVSELAKTNNFDFPGELATFVEQQATNQPLTVEDTTDRLWSWCPAILPKGQTKRIEGLFYVPRRKGGLGGAYSVRSELHGIRGGRTEVFGTLVSRSLKDYEHLIVVLASGTATPAAYSHFDRLLSVKMPQVEAVQNEVLQYYHVIRPSVEKTVPLPSHPLAWTTIAYVFWDDLDPGVLTNLQQQALLDWLHWGGQLIISGPGSLDKLRASFLAPYLPGEVTQTGKLLQADFDEINTRYSLARSRVPALDEAAPAKGEKLRRITILDERPMIGVELKLHPNAREMEGTGGLVVERRVGGGRVVATRFPLTDVRIRQWKNFDGFFNSVLLRRPARVFKQDSFSPFEIDWDDPNLADMFLEARLGSTLRYFSRDVGTLDPSGVKWQPEAVARAPKLRDPNNSNKMMRGGRPIPPFYDEETKPRPDTSALHPSIDDWHFAGYQARQPAGVAAWDDEGAASKAARDILTEAAGIEIPSANFVVKVLAIYLLVLVPLNWLVFWAIGKVEWAWIAAPIIALIGAGAVIRLAQLDIGFARSRTEVAVLEVQGGYERAHLTRYTALYTSLSSSYTLAFDEPSALAAPLPAKKLEESLLSITQYMDVSLRREKETSLAGVQVSSNSTGMVHSEQMLPLGKNPKTIETLSLLGDETKGYAVKNATELTIRDVGVFRRVDDPSKNARRSPPQIEVAFIARLDPGPSIALRFSPLVEKESPRTTEELDIPVNKDVLMRRYPNVWLDTWDKTPIFADATQGTSADFTGAEPNKTRIRLTRLAKLAADRLRLLPGDMRLIGWTDQRLPGMRINPEASQNNTYTLVLAHLARGPLPTAKPDKNVAEDHLDPKYQLEEEAAMPPDASSADPGLTP